MLINIRVGAIITIGGVPHKIVKAYTPLTGPPVNDEYLKLEVEDMSYKGGDITDVVIFAPVATDLDLGVIRQVLEHEVDDNG